MGKGGTTENVQIPEYIENAARRNLNRADFTGKLGFVPASFGPTSAAFTPMQMSAFGNTAQAANAFGLGTPAGADIYGGMTEPTTYANGVRAYSAAPLFDQTMNEFAAARPAQFEAINSMFIDPFSGSYTPFEPVIYPETPGATVSEIEALLDANRDKNRLVLDDGTSGQIIDGVFVPDVTVSDSGVRTADIGGQDIVIGGSTFDNASGNADNLSTNDIKDLADLGLAGTVTSGDGLGLEEVRKIARDRDRERITAFTDEAASTGLPISTIAQGLEAERDRPFGQTDTGTATSLTDFFVLDASDPRAEFLGLPTADAADYNFVNDLSSSLTNPDYNPEGTVVSRALTNIFGETSPEATERAKDMVTQEASERRESELAGLISTYGGQALLDNGVELAPDQVARLAADFGSLTTAQSNQQANLEQKPIPAKTEGMTAVAQVLTQASANGDLGSYVDSFLKSYPNTSRFQEKTGISSSILRDIEKIAGVRNNPNFGVFSGAALPGTAALGEILANADLSSTGNVNTTTPGSISGGGLFSRF